MAQSLRCVQRLDSQGSKDSSSGVEYSGRSDDGRNSVAVITPTSYDRTTGSSHNRGGTVRMREKVMLITVLRM